MNVLFITSFYPDPRIGGIERVTRLLGEWFADKGFAVSCLHFRQSEYEGNSTLIKGQLLENIYDREFLKSYLQENHIGIVINQSHFFYTPFLSQVVHECGAKLITCCHSSTTMQTLTKADALRGSQGIKRLAISLGYPFFKAYSERKLQMRHRKSLEHSDLTLVLSSSIEKQYRRVLNLKDDDKRLSHVCNPLSFDHKVTEEELRRKENIVLVVARLYEAQKKLSLLLKAWNLVDTKDWTLLLVGDGEDRERYERMAEELHLRNVRFEGTQDSQPYYRRAKIFAMTSAWEGLPMTLLESLQMGVVPVVMDSFPAAKDVISDGDNGILVDYPNVNGFAGSLQSLIDEPEMLESLSRNAVKSSRRFKISAIGEQWLQIFNKLTDETKV